MMRLNALLLVLLACGTALGAGITVYKWVDENGVVHYSDQPHPKAQKIELQSAQTYTSPPPPAVSTSTSSEPQAEPEPRQCTIVRPSADEVFMNAWSVTVTYRVEPALGAGARLFVVFDGQRLQADSSSTQLTLSPVDRGTHTVAIVAETAGGQTICQTAPVTFHVRQPSRLAPNAPNRPRF